MNRQSAMEKVSEGKLLRKSLSVGGQKALDSGWPRDSKLKASRGSVLSRL